MAIVALSLLAGPAALNGGTPATLEEAGREIAALKDQLRATRDRVDALEKIVAEFQKRSEAAQALEPDLGLPSPVVPLPGEGSAVVIPPVVPQSLPKAWEQRQFNGVAYYVVPLGAR